MDNKYYTPDISEVHVGLECEILNWYASEIRGGQDECRWDKHTIRNGADVIFNWLKFPEELAKATRVKYLDRDDIEELGWKYRIDSFWKEDKHKRSICLSSLGNEPDILWNISWDKGDYGDRMDFKIKNKSQLKTLMQWLRIS